MNASLIERRRFLQGAAIAGTTAVAVPTVLAEQVAAAVPGDSILVTVTLAGGNDGLNFLGPFADGKYRDLRGSMALNASSAHFAAESQYFHPQLSRLATRFRRGDVAVIQGVGDPGLDHSHFSNLARWQSANNGGAITGTGWLGRWLDNAGLNQFGGVGIGGRGVPLHMRGAVSKVTDLPSNGGGLYGADTSELRDRNMYKAIRRMGRGTSLGPWVDNVGANNALAVDAARSVAPAYAQALPEGRLLPELVLSARLLNLNLGTRVLNVWQHGYDTHDNQIGNSAASGDHADLLNELDIGLDRFFSTLNPAIASKVVVMLYSEFGRRAEPNGSRGTDHGAGGHVVLIGRSVKGGLYGEPPNLRNLDDRGDLRVQLDFRRVYATILETWLQADSRDLLGARYRTLGVIDDGAGALPEKDLRGRARQIRDRTRANKSNYLRYHSPRY